MTLEQTGENVESTHPDEVHGEPAPAETSSAGPTAAQLRRFIKSRPYVPLHELRRRFELNGELDEVCAVDVPDGHVFVGLPRREADFLATLVRDGEIGLELSKDPAVPIVVGVFAMKPVTRP
ncbi:MAG TPA: hypothetical protein VH371_06580 [Candidatus Limnocylindrales bacterium]|jgi:hypothetical protein